MTLLASGPAGTGARRTPTSISPSISALTWAALNTDGRSSSRTCGQRLR